MNNFYVGQKVVCVNAKPGAFNMPGHTYTIRHGFHLVEKEIYTIRELLVSSDDGQPTMKLSELPDRIARDQGYHVNRFRPLIEKKTDISIFTSILNNPKIEIKKDRFDLVDA